MQRVRVIWGRSKGHSARGEERLLVVAGKEHGGWGRQINMLDNMMYVEHVIRHEHALPRPSRRDSPAARRVASRAAVLAVIYGRRRCGKSTLLRRVAGPRDVYFLASQNDAALQRAAMAVQIGQVVPGFDAAVYPPGMLCCATWRTDTTPAFPFHRRISLPGADQPDLPSVLQGFLESPGAERVKVVLCGSSQRMMHGSCWIGRRLSTGGRERF